MNDFKRIGDFAKVRRGASPRPIDDPKWFGGEIGWVRIVDVTRSRRFLRSTEQYLSPLGVSRSVRVHKGDLIMSICATIGRPVIVDMPACIHDGFVQFYDINDADTEYLYYALQHAEPEFLAYGQHGTQANLNTTIVGRHELFVPPPPEQRKIARILTTMDNLIENTEALIAKYQAIKQGMMHDLFTLGIDEHGHLRPPRSEAPLLYKQSELGWIPKEWDETPLGLCTSSTITYGIVQAGPHVDGGVPYVRTGDMGGNRLVRSEMLCTSHAIARSFKRSELRSGDIVCAIRATVGKVLQAPPELDGANLTQGTARIAPKEAINTHYLLWALRSSDVQKKIQLAIKGTTFAEITLAELRRIKVPIPRTRKQQDDVAARLICCDEMIEKEERSCEKMRQMKTGLMQDLLTGKVRVTVDDSEDLVP